VARWTFNHYDGKLTESNLASAGMTSEIFSMVQSNLGKLGNAKRWGDNSAKKAEAKVLRAQGLRQVEIAELLGVTQKTVSKWLAG
jgi:DNA-binding transcriptional regulator YiaG